MEKEDRLSYVWVDRAQCGAWREKLHKHIFRTMSLGIPRSKARPQVGGEEIDYLCVCNRIKSWKLEDSYFLFKILVFLIGTVSWNGADSSAAGDSMSNECLQSPENSSLGTWNEAVLVGPGTTFAG